MEKNLFGDSIISPKPFLKWAGGKSQLIDEIITIFPEEIIQSKYIENYFEPFLGGGALFFYLKSYFKIKKSYINDINPDLILTYRVIQKYPKKLIIQLKEIKMEYLELNGEDRKEFFFKVRDDYNKKGKNFDYLSVSDESIERAKQLIFLNKTCFNGLYRVNANGEFNVPMGKYKNPAIFEEENIKDVSKALKNTVICNGSFEELGEFIDDNSLVYFDPPYRPLTDSASFTSYTKALFNDYNQIQLAEFCKLIDKKGSKFILSNSDPKNANEEDNFFDDLYECFTIKRVPAKRMINSNGNKRGSINELLIKNF